MKHHDKLDEKTYQTFTRTLPTWQRHAQTESENFESRDRHALACERHSQQQRTAALHPSKMVRDVRFLTALALRF
ncbi:MAG TPA: hypothetical protein VGO91_18300 [Pyrinomonadaceae bacterium]|nr:hypothetical protein [Pyrinomonadaceae bacterium]